MGRELPLAVPIGHPTHAWRAVPNSNGRAKGENFCERSKNPCLAKAITLSKVGNRVRFCSGNPAAYAENCLASAFYPIFSWSTHKKSHLSWRREPPIRA